MTSDRIVRDLVRLYTSILTLSETCANPTGTCLEELQRVDQGAVRSIGGSECISQDIRACRELSHRSLMALSRISLHPDLDRVYARVRGGSSALATDVLDISRSHRRMTSGIRLAVRAALETVRRAGAAVDAVFLSAERDVRAVGTDESQSAAEAALRLMQGSLTTFTDHAETARALADLHVPNVHALQSRVRMVREHMEMDTKMQLELWEDDATGFSPEQEAEQQLQSVVRQARRGWGGDIQAARRGVAAAAQESHRHAKRLTVVATHHTQTLQQEVAASMQSLQRLQGALSQLLQALWGVLSTAHRGMRPETDVNGSVQDEAAKAPVLLPLMLQKWTADGSCQQAPLPSLRNRLRTALVQLSNGLTFQAADANLSDHVMLQSLGAATFSRFLAQHGGDGWVGACSYTPHEEAKAAEPEPAARLGGRS